MSYLVNPLGWRLYFSKYWKINFFSTKKEFLLLFYQSRLFFEIILTELNRYRFLIRGKNLFTFSTFKLFLDFSFLYVLINYKIYWKNVFSTLNFINFKKRRYFKEKYFVSLKKKNWLTRSIRRRNFTVLFNINDEEQFFRFILNFSKMKHFKVFFKRLFFYFYFLPHLMYLKDFFLNTLNKLNSRIKKKIFFLGLNQKNFNINDILFLAEFLLRRKYRPNFILHSIVKILKFYVRRQKLTGFKFLLSGRFSRRDRATFLWKTFGAVSLGSRLSVIDYYHRSIILQYSKCIIKIWICRN